MSCLGEGGSRDHRSALLCAHLKGVGCVEQVLGWSTGERLVLRRGLPISDPAPERHQGHDGLGILVPG